MPAQIQQVLFARLCKYDAGTGEFEAIAADETVDKSREIFDYDTSKPFFKAWGDEFAKNTEGKSVGNVRSMHGKNAAGKLTAMVFDDEKKQIRVVGKIVDDRDALKMAEGVYTGVSIGGGYVKKWDDEAEKGATRYTADPCEVSLVDNPCNPNARFILKAAGAEAEVEKPLTGDPEKVRAAAAEQAEKDAVGELVKLFDARTILPSAILALAKAQQDDSKKEGLVEARKAIKAALCDPELTNGTLSKLAADHLTAEEQSGDEQAIIAALSKFAEFTDEDVKEIEGVTKREFSADERKKAAESGDAMKDGSYPIKTKADLRNAIQALGRAKNPAATKKHIIRRARALGATGMLPPDWPGSTKTDGEKAAQSALSKAADDLVLKGLYDCANLAQLVEQLHYMSRSAASEQIYEGDNSDLPDRLAALAMEAGEILCEMVEEETQEENNKATAKGELSKALEKGSMKMDASRAQMIHDHSTAMGAKCASEKSTQDDELSKLFGGATGEALKGAMSTAIEKAAKWDAAPVRKGVVRAISRGDALPGGEGGPTTVDTSISRENIELAQKAASGDLQSHSALILNGFDSAKIEAMSKLDPAKH